MSARRYERISAHDDDDNDTAVTRTASGQQQPIPNSPPPSFRSLASSTFRNRYAADRDGDTDPLVSDADRTLADTFDTHSDDDASDADEHDLDDRQRVMSGRPLPATPDTDTESDSRPAVERRVTQLPVFAPASSNRRHGGASVNDGVFANLSAKPERAGEDADEKPPSYEQAAADATPPYWENTILAPGGASSDEVYIDGLPVGSFFSFIWNGMISMSFQLVGFLLTYLLHTTHAAKNGSKAGLGITLLQYGFQMKGSNGGSGDPGEPARGDDGNFVGDKFVPPPTDPNAHNFDPNAPVSGGYIPGAADAATGFSSMKASDWFAYALMIVGWFILIRAITEYYKARRHEALVMQSPSRGLPVAVVADGEEPEGAV